MSDERPIEFNHAAIGVIPFGVALPSSLLGGAADQAIADGTRLFEGKGIVGTIMFAGKSAIIWFGWGWLESQDASNHERRASNLGSGECNPRPPNPFATWLFAALGCTT